jgi:hypothetical protein
MTGGFVLKREFAVKDLMSVHLRWSAANRLSQIHTDNGGNPTGNKIRD